MSCLLLSFTFSVAHLPLYRTHCLSLPCYHSHMDFCSSLFELMRVCVSSPSQICKYFKNISGCPINKFLRKKNDAQKYINEDIETIQVWFVWLLRVNHFLRLHTLLHSEAIIMSSKIKKRSSKNEFKKISSLRIETYFLSFLQEITVPSIQQNVTILRRVHTLSIFRCSFASTDPFFSALCRLHTQYHTKQTQTESNK